MKTDHIKIHVGPHGSSQGSYVELNGHRLNHVKSVDFHVDADEITQVTLTLNAAEVDLEGDVYQLINQPIHAVKE